MRDWLSIFTMIALLGSLGTSIDAPKSCSFCSNTPGGLSASGAVDSSIKIRLKWTIDYICAKWINLVFACEIHEKKMNY